MKVLSLDYEIRPACIDDIASFPAIEVAAAEIFPAEDLPAELREETHSLEEFARAVAERRVFSAICISQACPVGFAFATLVDGSAHLHEMDVLPSHARGGLGGALVQAVVDWAGQCGYPSLTLTTFRHLPWNAPFYERLGFRELPDDALTEDLARLLVEEEKSGFDRSKRIAMRRDLKPVSRSD